MGKKQRAYKPRSGNHLHQTDNGNKKNLRRKGKRGNLTILRPGHAPENKSETKANKNYWKSGIVLKHSGVNVLIHIGSEIN